jgi:hypothetical protein
MPSAITHPSIVRKTRFGLAGLIFLAVLGFIAIYFSRPTVVVGRRWEVSDRVGYSEISHQRWEELLHRFVDTEGNVDYSAWKNSPADMHRLNEYIDSLSRLDESRSTSPPQKLAYWINAYNAVTMLGILREYPTTSIQDHVSHGWGYNIWRDLRLLVGDKTHSLGEMEHSILRPLNEPRIHFAIVCASRGCPRLLNEAYTAGRLEEQLQNNTLHFFADATKCSADTARHELHLSPILKWYARDFGPKERALLHRISSWLPDEAKSVANREDVKVSYLDYDWSLNDQLIATPPLPPLE